ncbi:MAG: DUF4956 domain-containing protein [Lachnospiraceae bacterium]|nr:DUF4956 domain-containing protein [Lachnospiraceae bacterium]
MYGVKDIIKKSFVEGYSAVDITTKTVVIALLITAVLSLYIFFLYRAITRKTFYSKNFNISLVGVALITAAIIITIQSSIVVSLGMVGALSIVRFRTAVKDPLDLMFLFWAISTGIICGAGFAEFAVLLTIIMTIMVFVLNHIPLAKAPMILIVNAVNDLKEEEIMEVVKKRTAYSGVKSRNLTPTSLDLTIELRTKEDADLIRDIQAIEGVQSVALLKHDGETGF